MNLPNRLTFARIILIPFFLVFLHVRHFTEHVTWVAAAYWTALAIFIVAAITDYLDGAIARKHNIVTSFGQLFDPLADKLLTMSAFVAFVELIGPNQKPIFPAWAIIVILAREFLVTGLRSLAMAHGRVMFADKWGKQKTIFQLVGIITILLAIAVRETVVAAAVSTDLLDVWLPVLFRVILAVIVGLTAASGIVYLVKNWDVVHDRG